MSDEYMWPEKDVADALVHVASTTHMFIDVSALQRWSSGTTVGAVQRCVLLDIAQVTSTHIENQLYR